MNRLRALPLAALAFVLPARADEGFRAAVLEGLASRPLLGARDIYKLAHQSAFGPGHMMPSAESAMEHLKKEIASLGPARPGEKAVEEIGGGMARVNLRPFRDSGGSLEGLLGAMLETAKEMMGPEKAGPVMAERLEAARGMLAAQGKKGMADELARLAAEQAEKGYPHVGHSGAYRDAYWPAYRVVARSLAGGLAALASPGPPRSLRSRQVRFRTPDGRSPPSAPDPRGKQRRGAVRCGTARPMRSGASKFTIH
jgi:hypothetical protein